MLLASDRIIKRESEVFTDYEIPFANFRNIDSNSERKIKALKFIDKTLWRSEDKVGLYYLILLLIVRWLCFW